MQKLNLPAANLSIHIMDGKEFVFDILRKKLILLTPEEWVRQNFIHFLIEQLQYPRSLFKIETGLRYNKLLKRTDIIVFDRSGKIFLVVECKSTKIKLTQKVFEQVAAYSFSLQAKHIVVTNGLQHYCCLLDHDNKRYDFLKSIPEFAV